MPPSAPDEAEPVHRWSARFPLAVGYIGLLALVGGFGTWASLTTLAGAVIAPGQIELEQNRQVVQHPDGGVVTEILIREGEKVAAGQPLIRLDGADLGSQKAILLSELFEIMARRARLTAERDSASIPTFDAELLARATTDPNTRALMQGQTALMRARTISLARQSAQLSQQREQLSKQIAGVDAQSTALNTQLGLIDRELAAQKTLRTKGLAQASRLLALEREQASLQGSMGELAARKAQTKARIAEIEISILKLGTDRREAAISQLRDLHLRETELREKRRALDKRIARLEITAPGSGVVYDLNVFAPRSVIRPAEPLLYLVPQDRPLVITVRINPIHIETVYVNQPVTLRFSSFNQRTARDLFGHITTISADAFQDETTRTAYYRAEIALDTGELAKLPAGTSLLPGMPVEAFIRTDDRTPLSYLLHPFTVYFSKAFRES
ncbi:HlyD family type I secretion periplasmic adaptor subunit [Aquicoccus sp. G2-2]|uniref:HlyD family type I secretion periplasmic adaptor subunit n=1 Tax=Aquicoccus sp. G2-2 TaxID=3092120 RepID=UPI002AE08D00|nr:HlyD family type I secretion periplasmic adaptor subunit [Aquicoccus sp. G2-2]MEA1115125.1 HlyD family type I secretion periplasmic adaptor subunit [Aquicoccus sp. G2-2]